MSTIEGLIGRPLHELTDDELRRIVMDGRNARVQADKPPVRSKRAKRLSVNEIDDMLDDIFGDEDL